MIDHLRPFQRRFLRGALAPGIDTAACSLPRGNGKSALAGHLISRFLTPGDPIHEPGKEAVLLSGSIEQARIVFKFCRAALEPTGEYRFIDSATRVGIVHEATNTRLRVHGSNSRTAFGIVGVPFVVWDEPGAAETVGGEGLWDAVATAMGKPGSPLKAILIGTVAPSSSGWWAEMIADGSNGSTFVQALQGDRSTWDCWPTIRRVNPLTAISPEFRKKLLSERDKARADTRLKARFLSYRLNVPTADESAVLLTVDDWERTAARPVPEPEGRPVVGVDLGGGRAWSAAVAVWRNGRTEAIAVAPGIPSIEAQEKRDRVPRGTYQRLVERGVLHVAEGLRVPPPAALLALVRPWMPAFVVCDFFRLAELLDHVGRLPVVPRRTRWSEAAFDIRALRKSAKDGPAAVYVDSRELIKASLAVTTVKPDDAGSVRLVKRKNNTARDDVSSAWTLAAGAVARLPPVSRGAYLGVA